MTEAPPTSGLPFRTDVSEPGPAGGHRVAGPRGEAVRVARGSAMFFAGRIAGAGATFAAQVFLARWIGKAQLGVYVEALAWCLILSDLALLGFPFAGLRFIGKQLVERDHAGVWGFVKRTRQIVLATSIAIAVIAAAAIWILWPAGEQAGFLTALVVLASLPGLTLLRHYTGVAHAFTWFALVILPMTVLRPILFLAVLLGFYRFGRDLAAHEVLAVHGVVVLVLLLGLGWIVSRRLRSRLIDSPPTYETRLWLRTSVPLLIVSLYNGFFPELCLVILGLLAGPGDVAVFHAGARTAFFIGFALYAVDQSIMPRLSGFFAAGDKRSMQHTLVMAARFKLAAAATGAALMFFFGRTILSAFGEDFVVGFPVLMILASAQVVRALIGPVVQILGVTGHQDKSLFICAGSVIAMIVLNSLLVPSFGILGAAVGVLVVTVLSNLWTHTLVVRHVGVVPSIFGSARAG